MLILTNRALSGTGTRRELGRAFTPYADALTWAAPHGRSENRPVKPASDISPRPTTALPRRHKARAPADTVLPLNCHDSTVSLALVQLEC